MTVAWFERIGWAAVLGYAAVDLIHSRGAHWPWWGLIALGPALVLAGVKLWERAAE